MDETQDMIHTSTSTISEFGCSTIGYSFDSSIAVENCTDLQICDAPTAIVPLEQIPQVMTISIPTQMRASLLKTTAARIADRREWENNREQIQHKDDIWWDKRGKPMAKSPLTSKFENTVSPKVHHPTTASTLSQRVKATDRKQDEKIGVVPTPISNDSHLFTPTHKSLASNWTGPKIERNPSTDVVLSTSEPNSPSNNASAITVSSPSPSKKSNPSTPELASHSRLLKPTASLVAMQWRSKDCLQAEAEAHKHAARVAVNYNSGGGSGKKISAVSARLLAPTTGMKNGQWVSPNKAANAQEQGWNSGAAGAAKNSATVASPSPSKCVSGSPSDRPKGRDRVNGVYDLSNGDYSTPGKPAKQPIIINNNSNSSVSKSGGGSGVKKLSAGVAQSSQQPSDGLRLLSSCGGGELPVRVLKGLNSNSSVAKQSQDRDREDDSAAMSEPEPEAAVEDAPAAVDCVSPFAALTIHRHHSQRSSSSDCDSDSRSNGKEPAAADAAGAEECVAHADKKPTLSCTSLSLSPDTATAQSPTLCHSHSHSQPHSPVSPARSISGRKKKQPQQQQQDQEPSQAACAPAVPVSVSVCSTGRGDVLDATAGVATPLSLERVMFDFSDSLLSLSLSHLAASSPTSSSSSSSVAVAMSVSVEANHDEATASDVTSAGQAQGRVPVESHTETLTAAAPLDLTQSCDDNACNAMIKAESNDEEAKEQHSVISSLLSSLLSGDAVTSARAMTETTPSTLSSTSSLSTSLSSSSSSSSSQRNDVTSKPSVKTSTSDSLLSQQSSIASSSLSSSHLDDTNNSSEEASGTIIKNTTDNYVRTERFAL